MTRPVITRRVVTGLCLTAALHAGFSTHALHASAETAQTRVFRYLMGTAMRVEVYGGSPEDRQTAADEAFGAIAEVDRLMSDYRDDSELTAINRAAATRPVAISAPMLAVLDAAERIGVASNGAFDISVRPLMSLWGFKTRQPHIPTAAELAALRPLIDFRNVVLDRNAGTVRFTRPSVEIDLGGIAKGFAAEVAAGSIRRRGLAGMVDAGGNQHMVGLPPGKSAWSIGIRDPARPDAMLGTIDLRGELPGNPVGLAVSTSANSSNFLTSGAQVYGHLMDPRSLRPADASLSATVVSTDGTLADGLSKALFVLGPKNGLALLQQFPRTWGVVAYRKPDGTAGVAVSRGFESSFHPNDY